MRWVWRPLIIVTAALMVFGVVFGTDNALSRLVGSAGADAGDTPVAVPGADLSGTGAGSLISAMSMPSFSHTATGRPMQAARVLYRSTNGDTGRPTEVSGAVFVPTGDAPVDGWPVVGFAHGTTGINQPCAPSLSATLSTHVYWVDRLIDLGIAVALTDYQGLGSSGVHPYLDARTAGMNVIDSVRALRRTFPHISSSWAGLGGSQGGGAVWAADEQAATYAPELSMVGAVAWAPTADVTGLVDKAMAGTLTHEQGPLLQAVIESLARLHPEVNRDDYRHGAAVEYWDVLSACSGPLAKDRSRAASALGPYDLAASTPAAADRLRGFLQGWALPKGVLSAPLSIVYGDRDEYIDPGWTTAAINSACALGGSLVWQEQEGKGHGDVAVEEQLGWIGDRFNGQPAPNYCT